MRLKLDENVTVTARHVLDQFGHDVHSVHDEDLVGATDVELMQVCKTEGRMLVTFDVGFGDLRAHQPGSHPGVVLLRLSDQQPEAVLNVLRRLLADHNLNDLGGCLVVVSDTQVRLRRP